MSELTVSGNVAPLSPTERSRRFRERMKADCTRLDITIGADIAEKLKAMAKRQGVPVWKVVEEAIETLAATTSETALILQRGIQ